MADERRPTLLEWLRGRKPIAVEDVPWLVKDFEVLYRTAESALGQAMLDGYDTAHMRDLGRQLQRLAPAFGQAVEVKRNVVQGRDRNQRKEPWRWRKSK